MAFPGGRLSVGSVAQIYNVKDYSEPVLLQVLEIKKMVSSKSSAPGDRYRYETFSSLFC